MNISKNTHRPVYICDKCSKKIEFEYRKGRKVNKYYKYNSKTYTAKKDFDLCSECEKEFRKWLKEKPIIRAENIIDKFPVWEERNDK